VTIDEVVDDRAVCHRVVNQQPAVLDEAAGHAVDVRALTSNRVIEPDAGEVGGGVVGIGQSAHSLDALDVRLVHVAEVDLILRRAVAHRALGDEVVQVDVGQ
jgi:hypothetical protein